MYVQAKEGLPTRHVTAKTGGGLTYASKRYYEVFSRIEDRFFCTVVMRNNFSVDCDIIKKIKDDLLSDVALTSEFLQIMPSEGVPEEVGLQLYEMFVERMATLHGTELATQLMEEFAITKRKDAHYHKGVPRDMNPKYEQLRALRKKKKSELSKHKGVFDLTEEVFDFIHAHNITTTLTLH